MKFFVSFTYKDEYHDVLMEGEDEEDILYQLESEYEVDAFYDNHYLSDITIEEKD